MGPTRAPFLLLAHYTAAAAPMVSQRRDRPPSGRRPVTPGAPPADELVGRWPEDLPPDFVPFVTERCRIDQRYPPHRHEFAEVTFVLGGTGMHVADGCSYPLTAGEVYVIRPGVTHWFEGLRDFRHINFYLELERFVPARHLYADLTTARRLLEGDDDGTGGFANRVHLPSQVLPEVIRQAACIEREILASRSGMELVVRAHFHELLVSIERARQDAGPAEDEHVRASRVKNHIDTHYAEPVDLEELARVAGVSENHLLRLFRKVVGTTPMAYLAEVRLGHARDLIVHTETPITEIAHSLGFCDGAHLTNRFRQHFGVSPTELRRSRRRA